MVGPPQARNDAPPVLLPPARSGPKVLALLAALLLVFLGVLWYASFAALEARGPDRAFFVQESWANGTISLYVNDLDVAGEVPLDSLTANITTQDRQSLFDGALNRTVTHGNWSLTVRITDNDHSRTLTRDDDLTISASPPEAADNLIFTTFYLYSNGREWSHFPLPAD